MTAVADDRMRRLDDDTLHYVEHLTRILTRHVPAHVDRDDIQQAAKLAAVQAAQAFDDSHGVPFKAYLAIRVRGAVVDHLRSLDFANRAARARITAARLADDDYTDPAIVLALDVIPEVVLPSSGEGPESVVLRADAWAVMRAAIDTLPPRDRTVALCLESGDLAGAAERWGVTDSRVSHIRRRAMQRIRAQLAESGITGSDFDREQ